MQINDNYTKTNARKILRWKYLKGPQHLDKIQLYDVVFDDYDMDIRFPKRNAELLRKAGIV